MKKIILLCITVLFFAQAHAGLLYNYSDLALKDLDQMNKIVRLKIKESKKAGGDRVIPLKEALQAVFSRSNEDFMIEKILPSLRTELDELDAWERTLQALVKEAIGALKNPKAFKPVVQSTYQIFLENVISESQPRLGDPFENKIMTQIRDAKIEVTKEAANERRLRVMKESTSPSVLAEAALKEYEQQKAAAPAPTPTEATIPVKEPKNLKDSKPSKPSKETPKKSKVEDSQDSPATDDEVN